MHDLAATKVIKFILKVMSSLVLHSILKCIEVSNAASGLLIEKKKYHIDI